MGIALSGIGVSRGIALGRVRIWHHGTPEVYEAVLPARHVEEEVERYRRALERAKTQLRATLGRIPVNTPAEITEFFDAHLLMLDDSALAQTPVDIIRNRRCIAEWALKIQQEALVSVFDRMDDEYLKTRRDDVIHVASRILRELQRDISDYSGEAQISSDEPLIIVAHDLLPDDLVLLHHLNVAAVVTEHGGPLSHTAILARSLNLPSVTGAAGASRYLREGELVVVDGKRGTVLADVDPKALEFYHNLRQQLIDYRQSLKALRDRAAISRDGVTITLRANIELPEDSLLLRENGADGVGLYRTEFLYMNRSEPPGEEEQFETYRRTVDLLNGHLLTIRTLDAGVDKATGLIEEDAINPALGLRAIRLCLQEPNLFRNQLRAILRASAHGPVRILLPMITTVDEVVQTKLLLETLKEELRRGGIAFDEQITLGGMIEVPAAALCADLLARELDFLSIGTNDLIQYTLATDRLNERVNQLYDPIHPAVLRLVRHTIEAGRHHDIPVSLCGEMAADPELTRLLLGLGLVEFSLPPVMLPEVKQIILDTDIPALRNTIETIVSCTQPVAARELLGRLNS